ncbi:DUF1330 domain-containing protein [Ponticaulis sp.]|uniref:DUF1330 domain-containing protein n=1 Tax=Ponticaulis sp. TaxID=2020902 RepID=UPI000B75C482|nr:DUF1330 domain-containing protein [Ponticaulis sp.]RPG18958.1 MAG: DUF1330 domain-containing protein [Hyphomonadaceae bacterium TMED125]HBH89808.1 hypothetical protein [Hyphomonadaceae bacterium]MAJ09622.1 hypothetical protein [Ponticaulis sp.]MDF1679686.1 DUF1330 domain-containing protein [Ponticaulis sp.]HBJ93166.1 hypothetical protein [Hyphomonadaceae bacterium]|tara:strand:+ start:31702 stop:31989 length:288 start_codon:yes stop_codon:yes gene_type:complete
MPAFIVATVSISDMTAFKEYSKTIEGVSEKYGGESIVKGSITEMLEGSAPDDQRVVVSKFPDADSAKAYVNDPVYLDGKAKRKGAAIVDMRLIVV